MGIYINKGNAGFRAVRNSEYVDKTGLIGIVNRTMFTERRYSCVTRSRRFGKTLAAKTLAAYYDCSCQSRELFADLEIAKDPSFEEHLNKYSVIFIDMNDFFTRYRNDDIIAHLEKEVKAEVCEAFPDVAISEDDDLLNSLLRVVMATGRHFVMIIDEWDVVCREFKPDSQQMNDFLNWMRRMFKSVNAGDAFAAVYITGILPIKKFKVQSALNNFTEYSMVEPMDMASFFGFTKDEVCALAEKHQMDFDELEKWYDGYQIGDDLNIFNPNSVMLALRSRRCRSFWASTGAYDAIADYIRMDFDGLKDDIISMLAGARCDVDPTRFRNDLSEIGSRDDVLTVLIHLGYLSYNWRKDECYVPNREVSGELANAVKDTGWDHLAETLQQSKRLLQKTLNGDAEAVARALDLAHSEDTSILSYNDENSLACVVSLAYYYALAEYHVHREMPTGKGFADLVLLPRKNVDSPAIVIELKRDATAQTAIEQIKQKNYPQQVENYTGDILLVGISYDRQTKQHTCLIEHWEKK
jgi:hypothetical protein